MAVHVRGTAPLRAIDAFIVAEQERLEVPGVAVGVYLGGREHVAGFGVTSANHPLPVDGDTLFQIGSITKTMTATALLRLVDQGRLDLDAPVRRYVPELRLGDPATLEALTTRHLLTHAGGWDGDYFADFGAGDDALARIVASMNALSQLTPVGTVYSYNNAGFYIAGRLIEVLTGQPYEAAARELVFTPLGMERAFFFAHEIMAERFVAGHFVREDGPEVALPWGLPRTAHPVGGVLASARELLRYARFWLGAGAQGADTLLSAASRAEMLRPQLSIGLGGSVGLAWMLREADGVRVVAHGGATRGQVATCVLVPERSFGLCVLTNADYGSELCNSVTSWALRELLAVHDTDVAQRPVDSVAQRDYAGTYTAALSDIELRPEGDALRLHVRPKPGFPTKDSPPAPAPAPMRVALGGADQIVVLDAPMKAARGEFLRGPDGAIAWLRLGGRIRRRVDGPPA